MTHTALSEMTNASETPIVRRIDNMPEPESFRLGAANKSPDGLDLAVNVIAELVPGQGLVKRGYVKPNIPSFGAFELLCDEGTVIGGSDSAPAPLSYLAAGAAFCFLTHLKGYADSQGLDITSLKVEQRMKFQSRIPGMTADMGGQMEGHAKGMETCVIVETEEPPEAIARMIQVAETACMASQAVVTAVPAETRVIRNGSRM